MFTKGGHECEMLNYIEYLKVPTKIAVIIIAVFFVMQIIGEIIEFKGKSAPEILKLRKYFARRKRERHALGEMTKVLDEYQQMSKTIVDTKRLLADFDTHYNRDNIIMRNKWMEGVNEHIKSSEQKKEEQDKFMRELSEKLDKNNDITLSILIDNKRGAIIDFANKVVDENYPVTKEQFNRIFKIYNSYEQVIAETGRTNGEVDISIRIIRESYERHLKNHSFVEDVRGYNT